MKIFLVQKKAVKQRPSGVIQRGQGAFVLSPSPAPHVVLLAALTPVLGYPWDPMSQAGC